MIRKWVWITTRTPNQGGGRQRRLRNGGGGAHNAHNQPTWGRRCDAGGTSYRLQARIPPASYSWPKPFGNSAAQGKEDQPPARRTVVNPTTSLLALYKHPLATQRARHRSPFARAAFSFFRFKLRGGRFSAPRPAGKCSLLDRRRALPVGLKELL